MTEKTQHIEHHAIEADPALAAARRDRAAARAARERRPDASGPDPRAARESGDPAGAPELLRFAREAADNVACSM